MSIKKILCKYFSDGSIERNVTLQSIINNTFKYGFTVLVIAVSIFIAAMLTLLMLHNGDFNYNPTTIEAITEVFYTWLWIALMICGIVVMLIIYEMSDRVIITKCEREDKK